MGHKKLIFVAPAWREKLDKKTGTVQLTAGTSKSEACAVIATPIPDTNPVEYEYSCESITCEGQCDLRKRKLPDGTIVYECVCVSTPGSRASAGKRGKVKTTKTATGSKRKKTAGKKKRKR